MDKNKDKKSRFRLSDGARSRLEKFFNNKRNMYGIIAIAALAIVFLQYNSYAVKSSEHPVMPYPEFRSELEAGNVNMVWYNQGYEYMTVALFTDETREMSVEEREEKTYEAGTDPLYRVKYPGGEGFRAGVLETGAVAARVTPFSLSSLIGDIISITMLGLVVVLMIAMVKNGPMSILSENSKAMLKTSDVKFSDVIGQDEVIDDLKFIVDLMNDPSMGKQVGAKIPKGLLLSGPPGTGKTMLAKAIAGEAGVPFVQMSGSAFIEMYVGVGAKRVRDLFKLARKNAPCVIFIDEIDAIGCKRDKAGGTSENDQTINAMLEQMDGFDAREGVFVIAATNRADQLDEALVRPGRFDRQVAVNPPATWEVRKEMFLHYMKGLATDETVDVDALSRQTPGFTGADIAAVCNEAGIIAAMSDARAATMAHMEEAIDKKIFKGNRSRREQYENDKRRVAWHEAGHALVTWVLNQPITRASIQPTTSGVGGAVIGADPDTRFMTDKYIRRQVAICYAGRIAESMRFDEVSTGASSDITQATRLLRAYVESMGFDKDTGMLDLNVMAQDRIVSTQNTVQAMREISRAIYAETEKLMRQPRNAEALEKLAERLYDAESLSGAAVDGLLKKAGAERKPEKYAP